MKYLLPLLLSASLGATEIPEPSDYCYQFAEVAEQVQEAHQEGVEANTVFASLINYPEYFQLVYTIYTETPVAEDFYSQAHIIYKTRELALEACMEEIDNANL